MLHSGCNTLKLEAVFLVPAAGQVNSYCIIVMSCFKMNSGSSLLKCDTS